MTQFYQPNVPKEAPLILEPGLVNYSSQLPDTVNVRLKESAVAQQIATGLYKSPRAGFRELYSNECRAARTARNKFNAEPRIEITLNPKERILTIQGHNSLGITAQVFADVLRWMGRTTNDDQGEVGQFGWGFFALWTLADSVRLETYARETGEKYGVTAEDAGAFKPLSEQELTIREHGTRIQLRVQKKVDLAELVDWIEDNCRYSDVETWLTLTDKIEKTPQWGYAHVEHEAERKRVDNTFKEQIKHCVTDHCASDDRVIYEVEVDDCDYYFYGAIGGDDRHAHIGDDDQGDLLLLRVPIESKETSTLKFPFTAWILNIKAERKYPPTPDRDRFMDGALAPIIKKLQKTVQRKLRQLNITSIAGYRNAPWKGIYSSASLRSSEFIDKRTRELAALLSTKVIRPRSAEEKPAENQDKWRYYRRHGPRLNDNYESESLYAIAARSRHLFYFRMPRRKDGRPVIPAKRMEYTRRILRTKFKDAEVLIYIPSSYSYENDSPNTEAFLKALENTGEVNLDARAEAQRIKRELGPAWRRICGIPEPQRGKNATVDWPIHQWTKRGRVESERVKTSKIPPHVIRVPNNLKKYIDALGLVESKYGVTKDDKVLRGGRPLTCFLEALRNKTIRTQTDKPVTFDELTKAQESPTIYITDHPELLEFYETPTVAVDGDEAFELMAYLIAKGKPYATMKHPDQDAFAKKTGVDLEQFTHNYPCDGDSRRATIAYLGACKLKVPEIRLLFLHSVLECYSPDDAQYCLEVALTLESDLSS